MRTRLAGVVLATTLLAAGLSAVPSVWSQAPVTDEVRLTTGGDVVAWQWSPDGSRALVRRAAGQVTAVDLQGVEQPADSTGQVGGFRPVAPDGARRARLVSPDGASELWIERADGSDRRLLLRAELELFGAAAWSPDGSLLVLSRTPNGTETASYAELWLVRADGSGAQRLTFNQQSDEQPAFSPDGQRIGFVRNGDLWMRGLSPDPPPAPRSRPALDPARLTPPPTLEALLAPRALGGIAPQAAGVLTPPATIRVLHSQANHDYSAAHGNVCWNVLGVPEPTVNLTTTYSFEQYVKWVVPAEVPASWPAETLKAQAVAVRSYAWLRTDTHKTWTYDVTDWTDYQFMCPGKQDWRSDAAVDATRGQYGSYAGNVINAMYSAENSDPTLTYSPTVGAGYLTAVDDPVSFGRTRNGHGMGLSQWGAERWAEWYGWNYQRILTHYYTGITVQLPGSPSSDSTPPLVSPITPWPGWYLNSDRAALAANASDDYSGISSVTYTVRYSAGGVVTTTVVTPTFNLAAIPDQAGIQTTAYARDGEGKVGTGASTWGLDRAAPSGSASGPAASSSSTVALTLSASDWGPSGLASPGGVVVSNNWKWEGEDPYIGHPVGDVVSDTGALNGTAWHGSSGTPGRLYGPFVTLPNGSYRAWFRLRAGNVMTTSEVAFLEVIDNGDCYFPNDNTPGCTGNQFKRLGMKRVRGVDFRQTGSYQEFFVDFKVSGVIGKLEFPLWHRGTSDLWYDRVMVTSYPTTVTASLNWTLEPGDGQRTAQVRYTDRAGNISPEYAVTTVVDSVPPSFVTANPLPWYRTTSPTVIVTARDLGSGLNLSTAQYKYSLDGGLTWNPPDWLSATTAGQGGVNTATLTAPAVPFGQNAATANRVKFRVDDLGGRQSETVYTVPVDTVAPAAMASSPGFTPGSAVTVTWSGSDAVSGVASYDVQARVGQGAWTPWLTATTAASGVFPGTVGQPAYFRARATDVAGNTGAYRDGNGDAWTAVGGASASVSLPAGWNLVSMALRPVVTTTAESLARTVGAAEVATWQGGAWVSHLAGLPPNNFDLEPGRGYFVRLPAPAVWQTAGFTITSGITVPLTTGWNLVSAPQGTASYTAATLSQHIAESGAAPRFVLRWRAGAWGIYAVGLSGRPFTIDPGSAYFAYCDSPGEWHP